MEKKSEWQQQQLQHKLARHLLLVQATRRPHSIGRHVVSKTGSMLIRLGIRLQRFAMQTPA
ncbi:MAG TPA: hypothetical protein VKR06_19750 [Ktedonosporobacter sp.]|nr:hypothetical protein [Ktedonosporobacter sp.]